MNGKTTIDATINPHSADIDRHTYGCRWASITTRGHRFLYIRLLGASVDTFEWRWSRPRYVRLANVGLLRMPFGHIIWPLSNLLEREVARG